MITLQQLLIVQEILNFADTILEFLKGFGYFGAFAMAFSEALIAFLPLNLIVITNVTNYGIGLGFLLSWLGATTGSIFLFLMVRYFLADWFLNTKYIKSSKIVPKVFQWIDDKGLWFVLILMSIPVLAQFFISIVCALSKLKKLEYMFAIALARAFMIGSFAFLGESINNIHENPLQLVMSILVLVGIALLGKFIQKKYFSN